MLIHEDPRYLCDNCKEDLTYSSYNRGWRIAVSNDAKVFCGTVMYDCSEQQPFPNTLHFCDVFCMAIWTKNNVQDPEGRAARRRALKATKPGDAP